MIQAMTVEDYLQSAASASPTPGGGAVAAMTAASAVALIEMLANVTVGKKGYEDVQERMQEILQNLPDLRMRFFSLANEDARVFDQFMTVLRLPKDTEEEQAYRKERIQEAYKAAAMVPFEIGQLAFSLFQIAEQVIRYGNRNAITDGIIGAINARAAVKSAFLNVKINLKGMTDSAFVEKLTLKMAEIEETLDQEEARLIALGGY